MTVTSNIRVIEKWKRILQYYWQNISTNWVWLKSDHSFGFRALHILQTTDRHHLKNKTFLFLFKEPKTSISMENLSLVFYQSDNCLYSVYVRKQIIAWRNSESVTFLFKSFSNNYDYVDWWKTTRSSLSKKRFDFLVHRRKTSRLTSPCI